MECSSRVIRGSNAEYATELGDIWIGLERILDSRRRASAIRGTMNGDLRGRSRERSRMRIYSHSLVRQL